MATLQELEQALIVADRAGAIEDARAIASAIYEARQAAPKSRGVGPVQGERLDIRGPAEAALIGAGRQADKFKEGVKQLGLSANVAAREVTGLPNAEQLRELAAMEQMQTENDRAYQPLRDKHPFATGAGEMAFMLGAPMGAPTAAARIGIPAAVGAAEGALSYGSPEERGVRAAQQGALAGLGGSVSEGIRALVSPAKVSLTSAQQEALRRASEKIGYTPRASEMTGSETLRRLEDAVARQPGGAGPMRELMDRNQEAVNRTAGRAVGEDAGQLTEEVLGSASDRLRSTYEGLRSRATMPVTSDIFDAVTRAEKMLTRGDVAAGSPKGQALSMVQRLKDQFYQTKQFDGETYQSWTSDLAAAARTLGKENRTAAAALREVEKAMDKVARGADEALWKQTDKQNASLETLLKSHVVNTQTGNVSPLKVAGALERQFGKNMKTGKLQGEMADIAALGRAMPPMREGSQTAGREAFGGLPGWMMAGPNYAAAKALTSEFGRDYLARGLLGNPAVSRGAGGLLGRGSIPLSISEIEMLFLGQ